MGSGILKIGTLMVIAIIVVDILKNPTGTAAASKGLTGILTPSLQATTGQKVT
jgi:hypothetical protein